jgi:hypothetical protein
MTGGPEPDDIAAEMARLEAALERIGALSASAQRNASAAAPIEPWNDRVDGPVPTEVAHRLDSMIARLRAAIDEA